MASIFDLYGIKEVADVVFWDLTTGNPVLYLDTLKVSTIEETAEQTEARGGKGNPPLIIWDYGKEITITLEDALFSMKSMSVMHNSEWMRDSSVPIVSTVNSIQRATKFMTTTDTSLPISLSSKAGLQIFDGSGATIASTSLSTNTPYIATWKEEGVTADSIVVRSDDFPGTYKITGDTYARSQATGKDEFFQFVIPQAKINPEQTITMQAEGDPSTFSMTVRVMRPADGKMMELIKYAADSNPGPEPVVYSIGYGQGEQYENTIQAEGEFTPNPTVIPEGSELTWTLSENAPATFEDGKLTVSQSATTSDDPFTLTATMVDDTYKTLPYRFQIAE